MVGLGKTLQLAMSGLLIALYGTGPVLVIAPKTLLWQWQDEMRRLLAPGGRLVLVDGFRDNIIGWVAFDVIITRVEGHVHHASWPQMHEYFATAGFANIRRRKFSFWMPGFATVGEVS